ncbi:AfsR/SARP family transcriptional regulator [Nocardiopsis aegyptia]|uniref:Putative ATPase/DNA-binding SARP family transcriptional activator n=1 Tax=Nocardiopsis aegyptia TaxID=220378 RepID=A0A7Z0J8W3_9ACTN|nr:BTAD domain-containing putative transcriptional regulator [Nocardiopsis aegyptia]NYJ33528.1 putative ATPase/DNA-binding SARP family transcriptional activator [Nocardiopsis aegyptia]
MRFGVLGQLAVWTGEDEPVRVPGAKVRALLAHLLVHRGTSVSADRLGAELWDRPAHDTSAALQTAVSRLRGALDRAEAGARGRVESGPSGYRLRVDPGQVDADRFEDLVGRARGADPSEAADLLGQALELWRGPALADHADASFAGPAIARWEEMRLTAVEDRARARLDLGEDASLVAELDELLRAQPLRERLRAAHMIALYRSGRQTEALESYRRGRDLLAREIGVEPGPELVRLHERVLAQSPDLARPAAPATSTTARVDAPAPTARPATLPATTPATSTTVPADAPTPTAGPAAASVSDPGAGPAATGSEAVRLPAPLTDVVGRQESARRLLVDLERFRLVTLVGPGGVGKTTLALSALSESSTGSPVWFVELASRAADATTPDDIADAVAAAMGLHDEGDVVGRSRERSSAERLAVSLGTRPALLILDNCEHVTEPAAALAVRLLRAAPGLRMLATSREPLGVPGERLHQVRPLRVPCDDSPAEIAGSDAVELFTRRVSASLPSFTLDEDNAEAVATICRRLDGLPLALELAAARVRSLGVRELATRLDDRFQLLGGGSTGLHERQQTLRAMVDWSWRLLTEAERAVLRRLSVHVGVFSLEAAETIAIGPLPDGGRVETADAAAVLAALVDRSLVVSHQDREGTCFRLLETIRAFALQKLAESGEEHEARSRHAHHTADVLAGSEPLPPAGDIVRSGDVMDRDGANIRAAAEWAADDGNAGLALRITGSLGWSWYLRGRYREGGRLLSRALAASGPATETERAVALLWRFSLAFSECPHAASRDTAREALALAERSGDPLLPVRVRTVLVYVTSVADGPSAPVPAPRTAVEEACRLFEASGDAWWLAFAQNLCGWWALRHSELAEARRYGRRSLDHFRTLGEPWGQVRAYGLLGVLAEIEGAYEEAADLHRTALDHAERIGLWTMVVEEHTRLARVHMLTGDFALADDYNHRALRLSGEQAFDMKILFVQGGLAMTARRRSRPAEAEQYLRGILAAHRRDGYRPGQAFALAELGMCAEARGDAAAARELHAEGLEFARLARDPRAVAMALEGLAGADALDGEGVRAARLLGAAARAREEAGAPMPAAERFDVDRITAAVRGLLGDAGLEREWAHGHGWMLSEAVPQALGEPVPERA